MFSVFFFFVSRFNFILCYVVVFLLVVIRCFWVNFFCSLLSSNFRSMRLFCKVMTHEQCFMLFNYYLESCGWLVVDYAINGGFLGFRIQRGSDLHDFLLTMPCEINSILVHYSDLRSGLLFIARCIVLLIVFNYYFFNFCVRF